MLVLCDSADERQTPIHPETLVQEAKKLAANGVKELILIAQDRPISALPV